MAAAQHCSLFSLRKNPTLLSYNVRQANFQVISRSGCSQWSIFQFRKFSPWSHFHQPAKWGHARATRGQEEHSPSPSCTAGPPRPSTKRRSHPLAHTNADCNSCTSNYEEEAHATPMEVRVYHGPTRAAAGLHLMRRSCLSAPPSSPSHQAGESRKTWKCVVGYLHWSQQREKGRIVMGKSFENTFPVGWAHVCLTRKAREAAHSNAEKKEMVLHFSQSHKFYQRASNGKTASRGIFIHR